jgi:hypothetical protein
MEETFQVEEAHTDKVSGNLGDVTEAVQKMLEDGFFDGLVQRYEGLYPDYAPLVEDVVLDGVAHLAIGARTRHIRDPRALLLWRVRRRVLDLTHRPPGRYGDTTDPGDECETPEQVAERNKAS